MCFTVFAFFAFVVPFPWFVWGFFVAVTYLSRGPAGRIAVLAVLGRRGSEMVSCSVSFAGRSALPHSPIAPLRFFT